jgi:protein-S-isoprenylcysteine O-methyltransferase Ste14
MKGKFLVGLQFFLLGALFLSQSVGERELWISVLCVLMAILALTLLLRGFRDLGDALTPLPESKSGATLVTTGIYSSIRHPIYSSLFLLSSSVLLWKRSLPSMIISVCLVALLIYKAKYEDSLLKAKFPEAEKYQNSIPPFIPRLRKRGK